MKYLRHSLKILASLVIGSSLSWGWMPKSLAQAALPIPVANLVRQDLARRLNLPSAQLRILDAESQTWPNGCLGLEVAGEVCTQALIPGWRVRVTQGERVWVYRSNRDGSQLRLENPDRPSVLLSGTIAQTVLADVARRSALTASALKITSADRRNWSDSCLGLGGLDLCAEVIVPGWQVVVSSRQQQWVYRTDLTGNLVRLDLAASRVVGRLIQAPGQIPADQLPQPLSESVRFRVISAGGLLNQRTETWLESDGRILQTRTNDKGEVETKRLRQIKPEAQEQFQQLLQQRQFNRFHQFDYLAPQTVGNLAVTPVRVMLSAPQTYIRYADSSQAQLPEDLQQVIRAWENLVQTGQIVASNK